MAADDDAEAFVEFRRSIHYGGKGETREDYILRVAKALCRLYDDVQRSEDPEALFLVNEFQGAVEHRLELSSLEKCQFRQVIETLEGRGL